MVVHCITCNKEFQSKYKGHKYCSRSCAVKINNSLFPKRDQIIKYDRQCKWCTKDFTSRHPKTVYCSIKCSKEYDYSEYIEGWKRGENSGGTEWNISNPVKRYILRKYNNRCTKCGWNEIHSITKRSPLQINHIDGNGENHREENLELLCPNCHSLTTNYGALNIGKGRKLRRERYRKVSETADVALIGRAAHS